MDTRRAFAALGVSAAAENVYRLMLAQPAGSVADLAHRARLSERQLRAVLDELVDLALLRTSADVDRAFTAVGPQVGLTALMFREQAEMTRRQQRIGALRAAAAAFPAGDVTVPVGATATRLTGPAEITARLRRLASTVRTECLMLSPVPVRGDDAADARRPVYKEVLDRGVSLRAIHTADHRTDPGTRSFAGWLTGLGAQIRTARGVPLYLIVVDRRLALVPLDPVRPHLGAVEVGHPGVVADLVTFFEQIWAGAVPLDAASDPPASGLTDVERDLLRLLGDGHTDESAGRRLGLSVRTVRRMMAGVSDRLGARSRFQAGLLAARHGWL